MSLDDVYLECGDTEVDVDEKEKKRSHITGNFESDKNKMEKINNFIILSSTLIGLLLLGTFWNRFIQKRT